MLEHEQMVQILIFVGVMYTIFLHLFKNNYVQTINQKVVVFKPKTIGWIDVIKH